MIWFLSMYVIGKIRLLSLHKDINYFLNKTINRSIFLEFLFFKHFLVGCTPAHTWWHTE